MASLRRRYPDAHIAWVVNHNYEALLHGHPDLSETIPFYRGASRTGIVQACLTYRDFLRRFRSRRFDLVVDLQGLLRSGLITACSGAARRVAVWQYRKSP